MLHNMSLIKSSKRLIKKSLWKLQPNLFHKLVKRKGAVFSIGIYTGNTPIHLKPKKNFINPVLTYRDITDCPADYVADPFMCKVNNRWYMFFEVMCKLEHRGLIASAISDDGFSWKYNKIVLSEPFHLAYPYVFQWREKIYMIPDSGGYGIRLYQASSFPNEWRYVKTILDGDLFVDSSIFEYEQKWWLLTASSPTRTDLKTLHCFYADSPLGPWQEHPCSPIVEKSNRISRPGGRVLVVNDRPIRFAQDGFPRYGTQVRAFEIVQLTTSAYVEQEIPSGPVLTADNLPWNSEGMHHVDAHCLSDDSWIACVDGWFSR